MTQTSTPTTLPSTFRGAPILPPPPAIEAAARAWILAHLIAEQAHTAYGIAARLKPFNQRTASEREALDRAWDHWLDADRRRTEARVALHKAVEGPHRACWGVRGYLFGWGKTPRRNGFSGNTLFILFPDDELNPLTKGVQS